MKTLARLFGMGSNEQENQTESIAENLKVSTEEIVEKTTEDEVVIKNNVRFLAIDTLVPNPFQPRKTFNDDALKELAESIREFGVIQPLLVRCVDDRYEVVAGERRMRASSLAGLTEVPAIVRELSDKEMAEIAMIENLQREDLHFLEEAEGFHQLLVNFGFTQEVLAKRMGKSQSTVANKLRLLKLSGAVRKILLEAALTERHARALLKLSDEAKQLEALHTICEKELNVRDSEMLIKEMLEELEAAEDEKKPRQNVVRIIRDVRIFLNTIQNIANEMEKSGLKVDVKQEQDDEFITLTMVVPKRKQ